MVEMIYDEDNKNLKVLEFSPRIVGGQIAKMVKYASGVNLKKVAIDLFINQQTNLENTTKKNIVVDICEIDSEKNIIKACNDELLKGYKLIEQEEKKSTIGENMLIYKIYENE